MDVYLRAFTNEGGLVLEPFWNRIDFVDCGVLLSLTANWAAQLRPS